MKKILFLGKIPPPYIGPAFATQVILKSNLNKKYKLIHFDLSHHSSFDELGKKSFKNFFIPFIQYFKYVGYILYYNPQLIYMPCQQTTIAYLRDIPFILIAKLFRKKIALHLRGANFLKWYNNTNILIKKIVYFNHKLIDGQIVLGENLKNIFINFIDFEKIHVIPNGYDIDFPIKNKNTNKINISFLGNFIRSKGIIDFLQSIQILPTDYKKRIIVNLAGNWREEDTKSDIKNIILNNKDISVKIYGQVIDSEKEKFLINTDLFVYPTYHDGLPWVIIEAVAAGLPIISTDQGAIIEAVKNDYNGFIVPKHSPKEIAKKIIYLLDNPTIMEEMSKNSKRHYYNNFTEKKIVEKFIIVFDKIMK